jgi:hypothetical protein
LLNDLFVLLEDLIDINWRQVFLYWLSIKYGPIAIYCYHIILKSWLRLLVTRYAIVSINNYFKVFI